MSDVKISIRDNGPALITGSFTVEDADGNQFDTAGRETIALCRCGLMIPALMELHLLSCDHSLKFFVARQQPASSELRTESGWQR